MNQASIKNDKDIDKQIVNVKRKIPIPISIITTILLFFVPIIIYTVAGEFSKKVWTIMLEICVLIILAKLFLYIIVTKLIKIKKYDCGNKSILLLLENGLAKIQLLDNLIKFNDANFINYSAKGYVRFCEYFLKAGIDPNVEDINGQTALYHAILQNKKNVLKIKKLLLDSGANPNIRGADGECLFISDIYSNDFISVKYFIENGADINQRSLKGELPIFIAVANGYEDLVELLASKGADTNINCVVNNGSIEDRLIFYAIDKGNLKIIDAISKCSDIISVGSNGKTPLFYAVEKNKKEVIKVLLKYLTKKNLQLDKKIKVVNENLRFNINKYKEIPGIDFNMAVEILLREDIDGWLPKVQSILNGETKLIDQKSGVLIGAEFDSIEYELYKEEKIVKKENESTNPSEVYIKELKEYVSKNYINRDKNKYVWNKACPVNSEKVPCTNRDCDDGTVLCPKCDGDGKLECEECGGEGKINCDECKGNGKTEYYCSICNGDGELPYDKKEIDCPCVIDHSYRHDCLKCEGKGKDSRGNTCQHCKGKGYICSICNNSFELFVNENEEYCKCNDHYKYEHLLSECKKCDGTGFYNNDICPDCKGRKIICQKCNNEGIVKNNNLKNTCWNCHGTGGILETCHKCHGDRKIDCPNCDDGYVPCNNCNSKGWVNCSTCGGKGYLNRITYQHFSYKSISKYKNNYFIKFDSNNILDSLNCNSIDFYERLNIFNNIEVFRLENAILTTLPNNIADEELINSLRTFISSVEHAKQNILLERLNIIPAKYDMFWIENTDESKYAIMFINNEFLMNALL